MDGPAGQEVYYLEAAKQRLPGAGRAAGAGHGGAAMMRELVLRNRSYRRFYQDHRIEAGAVRDLIDMARLCASAMNHQPLKYLFSCDPDRNGLIFPHLAFARQLRDWGGPVEGERPSAYIVVLGDTRITRSFGCDHGIAAQTMLLGAVEKGLGGCMLASVDRDGLRRALGIPPHFEILLVLALGKPKEKVVLEDISADGDTSYWRDREGVHHVPKRRLEDVIPRWPGADQV